MLTSNNKHLIRDILLLFIAGNLSYILDISTSKNLYKNCISFAPQTFILLHHYKIKKVPLIHIRIPDGSWIKSANHYKIENGTLYADLIKHDTSVNATYIEIDYNFKYSNENGEFKKCI